MSIIPRNPQKQNKNQQTKNNILELISDLVVVYKTNTKINLFLYVNNAPAWNIYNHCNKNLILRYKYRKICTVSLCQKLKNTDNKKKT